MSNGDAVLEPPVGLADPGREISGEALREIYFGINHAIDDLISDFCPELEVEGDDLVEVEVFLGLPDQYASSAAATIDSLDLVWRLAWAVAEIDPQELPASGGTVDIDELIPVIDAGLLIERVEIGSIRVWFRQNKRKMKSALATLSMVASLAGVDAQEAISLVAHGPDQTPCYVNAIRKLDEQPTAQLKEALPGLAPDSVVKITIKAPNEGRVIAEVRPAV